MTRENYVGDRNDCTVVIDKHGLTIGRDMHMNGLDSPAHILWHELEALIDLLGAIRAEHVAEQYQ